MSKWVWRLLIFVGGVLVFLAVTMVVEDQYWFVDYNLDLDCQSMIGDQASACYEAAGRTRDAQYEKNSLVALISGGVAALLFWFFAWRYMLRRQSGSAAAS